MFSEAVWGVRLPSASLKADPLTLEEADRRNTLCTRRSIDCGIVKGKFDGHRRHRYIRKNCATSPITDCVYSIFNYYFSGGSFEEFDIYVERE